MNMRAYSDIGGEMDISRDRKRLTIGVLAVVGLVAAIAVCSSCGTAQKAAEVVQMVSGDPVDAPQPGPRQTIGTRYAFGLPETDTSLCKSLYAPSVSMPCRLVLNICDRETNSTMLMPANFTCSAPDAPFDLYTPTLAEACAQQPEYATWYGCP